MIVHNFDPTLIDFGIIQIRWYSLAYIFGILLGWWYGKIIIKKQISPDNYKIYLSKFDDLIGYLIVGIILIIAAKVFFGMISHNPYCILSHFVDSLTYSFVSLCHTRLLSGFERGRRDAVNGSEPITNSSSTLLTGLSTPNLFALLHGWNHIP